MPGVAAIVGFLTLLESAALPAVDGSAATAGLRPLDEQSVALISAAQARSQTVRDLVDQLSRSDLVIYVRFSVALHPPRATTHLVSAAGSFRFIAITLSEPNPLPIAIEMLGHELAHAAEIAGNPLIRSAADLAAYYRSVGRESTSGHGFDTARAVDTQRRIRREIG